jgi:hypothetical protein
MMPNDKLPPLLSAQMMDFLTDLMHHFTPEEVADWIMASGRIASPYIERYENFHADGDDFAMGFLLGCCWMRVVVSEIVPVTPGPGEGEVWKEISH